MAKILHYVPKAQEKASGDYVRKQIHHSTFGGENQAIQADESQALLNQQQNVSRETGADQVAVQPVVDQVQPVELTTEEVCRYLQLQPKVRKYFINQKGQYVRSWIEEHIWCRWCDGSVSHYPKKWAEGEQSAMHLERLKHADK